MLRTFITWLYRYRWPAFIISCILTILIAFNAMGLGIKSDFLDLLPDTFQSVVALKKITKEMGGIGNLIVVAESKNRAQNIKFLSEFSEKAQKDPTVLFVDFKKPLKFIERNGILWLPQNMLQKMYNDLKRRIDYERKKAILFLPEELGPAPQLMTAQLLEELEHRTGKTPYYENEDGSLMIALVKPARDSADLDFSGQLVNKMKKITEDINKKYPDVKVGLTGLYFQKIEQLKAMGADFKISGLFTIIGIAILMFWYFRSPKGILITMIPLLIGIIWTLGFTHFIIGHVNIVSGFFLSILMGLGIDYSLQLYSRYKEEILAGAEMIDALVISIETTGKGTLFGALTTLGVFMLLMLTKFTAFRETGILSSAGIILIFISIIFHLPVYIFLLKPSLRLLKNTSGKETLIFKFHKWLIHRSSKSVILVSIVLVIISVFAIPFNRYEYDMRKLENSTLTGRELMEKLKKVFPVDFAPAIAVTRTLDKLSLLREELRKKAKIPGNYIADHRSILDYYPYPESDLKYRLDIVGKIRRMLIKNFDDLSPQDKKTISPYMKYLNPQPESLDKYPSMIKTAFVGNEDGKPIYFYYIYPPSDLGMGKKALTFAKTLKNLEVPKKELVASDTILLQEIISLIVRDGEFLMPVIIITLIGLIFIMFRTIKGTLLVMLPLVMGLTMLTGFLGYSHILVSKGVFFNHFNVVMIPILLGVGIDYGIHIYHRILEDYKTKGSFEKLIPGLHETTRALFLSAATTVMGFMSLFLASYPGFRSMAWISVPGITAIFLVSVVILPAIFYRTHKD